MDNKTLVVMAAGMGSRFGGLKQLEPIGKNGEVLLDYSVYDAKQAGFNKVVFVIKKQIEKDFTKMVGARISKTIDVDYCFQELDSIPSGFKVNPNREKPYGTGHAILCCKNKVKTPFAVINADDFYGKNAYKQIFKGLNDNKNYCMVGFLLKNTLTENGTVSRGVCEIDENNKLKNIVEYTKIFPNCTAEQNGEVMSLAKDTVVSMNFWGFNTDIFNYLEEGFIEFLKNNNDNIKAEYFLPFKVDQLIKSNKKNVNVLVALDKWYGMTYKEDKPLLKSAIDNMTQNGMYNF